jgi:HAD superfamily hydrolase (TIGR01509 family)
VLQAAVILDVDGTLVDSNDAHARAWVDAFRAHGIAVAYDSVRRSIGMGGDKLMPAVSGIDEDSPRGEAIAADRSRFFKQRYLPNLRPFEGVRPLVERFAADGFTIAVASSAKEEELQPLLEIAGVSDLIARRTSSDDAEASKPEPDIVQAALTQCGCPASRAIMLGDTPYDVEAATRAGVAIVGVESGGWRREDLGGALAVYGSPADLLAGYDASPFARMRGRASHAEA